MNWIKKCATIVTALLVIVGAGWTQDSSTGMNPPAGQDTLAQPPSADLTTATPPVTAGQINDGPAIRELGSANFLSSNVGWFRWGPLHLGSSEVFQGYNRTNGGGAWMSVLRTHVLAERRFGRNLFVVQYSPKLTVVSGSLIKNFSDQDSTLDGYYALTPRLGMSFSDHFQIFNTNSLTSESFISADPMSSFTVQKAFLEGPTPTRYLANSVATTFSYKLSPLTQISVAPSYTYSKATGLETPTLSHTYGATVQLEHALTARRTVGAYYGYQVIRVEEHDRPFVTPYNNIGINYSEQLTPTWGIQSGFGAFKEGLPEGTRWSGSAHVSTTKSFGRSSVALVFFRGQGLAGVVTSNNGNRLDALYNVGLSRRIRADLGAGYVGFKDIHAKYGTVGLDWQMGPNLSTFVRYAYKYQAGDGNQIGNLTNGSVIFGLRWHPNVQSY